MTNPNITQLSRKSARHDENQEDRHHYRPWSDLHQPLLLLILSHIAQLSDYIRFAAVCAPWRSARKTGLVPSPVSPHPWLICPSPSPNPWLMSHHQGTYSESADQSDSELYSIILPQEDPYKDGNSFHKIRIPGTSSCTLHASSLGWLLFSSCSRYKFKLLKRWNHEEDCKDGDQQVKLFLINPVTNARINLPSRPLRDVRFLTNMLLTAPPTDANCVVLVQTEHLIFCQPGAVDAKWVEIDDPEDEHLQNFLRTSGFTIACNGNVFLLIPRPGNFNSPINYRLGTVTNLLGSNGKPKVTTLVKQSPPMRGQEPWYPISFVVESSGCILLVVIYQPTCPIFEVFRMDMEKGSWVRVESVPDQILYLSLPGSISVVSATTAVVGSKEERGGGNLIYVAVDSCLSKSIPCYFNKILTDGNIKMRFLYHDDARWLQPRL